MKKTILLISLICLAICPALNAKCFHDFTVKDIDGKEVSLSAFKGKKVMAVNVASKCRYTPQYTSLQALYNKHKDKGFVIVAFPCNDFGEQEPGTNAEILTFCSSNYNVDFPIMAKISAKGEDIAPVYKWLTSKDENGVADAPVEWNFQKFLIDEKGAWVKSLPAATDPMADEIVSWITLKEE